MIFIYCPWCGKANEVKDFPVSEAGTGMVCIHCMNQFMVTAIRAIDDIEVTRVDARNVKITWAKNQYVYAEVFRGYDWTTRPPVLEPAQVSCGKLRSVEEAEAYARCILEAARVAREINGQNEVEDGE